MPSRDRCACTTAGVSCPACTAYQRQTRVTLPKQGERILGLADLRGRLHWAERRLREAQACHDQRQANSLGVTVHRLRKRLVVMEQEKG